MKTVPLVIKSDGALLGNGVARIGRRSREGKASQRRVLLSRALKEERGWINRREVSGNSTQETMTKVDPSIWCSTDAQSWPLLYPHGPAQCLAQRKDSIQGN